MDGIHSNTPGESLEQQHANTEHRENRRSGTEKEKLEGELPYFFLPLSPVLCPNFPEIFFFFALQVKPRSLLLPSHSCQIFFTLQAWYPFHFPPYPSLSAPTCTSQSISEPLLLSAVL